MKYTSTYYGNLPRADWGGALTGAGTGWKMGSSIGSVFGPIGKIVGGGLGAITGVIFGNKAENKRLRLLKKQQAEAAYAAFKAKQQSDAVAKNNTYLADLQYLNTMETNNQNDLFMKKGGWIQKANASIKRRGTEGVCTGSKFGSSSCPAGSKRYNLAKTFRKMAKNRADGGEVDTTGVNLGEGDKLITSKTGKTAGTHESGQNIPIKKGKRTLAVAEPGEILVNNPNMPMTPFILSKRIGRYGKKGMSFADEYLTLEGMRNAFNSDVIDSRQGDLIKINNSMITNKTKRAAGGSALLNTYKSFSTNNSTDPILEGMKKYKLYKAGLPKTSIPIAGTRNTIDNPYKSSTVNITGTGSKTAYQSLSPGTVSSSLPGLQKYSGTMAKQRSGLNFKGAWDKLKNIDENTVLGGIGAIANLAMTNKALKRQAGYINDSLKQSLAYEPKYMKNYLLDDTLDVSDATSAANQSYMSAISGLTGIDPAVASALRTSAASRRTASLNSIYGERNRSRIGIRNQNVANILATNNANTELNNQTALMKLNAKISANEQLGDLEAARLASVQGAVSEFNSVLRDRDTMKSLKSRWADTIGIDDVTGKNYKCGGKIGRRKKRVY